MSKSLLEKFAIPLGAYAAVWGCGFLSMVSMPYLVGSTIADFGFTETEAGLLGTIELLVVAATAMILAPKMKSLPRRNLAIFGIIVALIGHILSMVISDYWPLAGARAIAAIGAGAAIAAGQACIASTDNPGKTTAHMMTIFALAVSIFLVGMGYFSDTWGVQGAYGFEALWVSMMLPIVFLLPKKSEVIDAVKKSGNVKVPPYIAFMAVGIVFLYTIADASVWSFTERKASSIGMSFSDIGWVLGASLLIGAIGGVLAGWLGDRYGRTVPYVIGLSLSAWCAMTITGASSAESFAIGQLVYGITYTFTIPFLYRFSAELDPSGSIIVVATSSALIGGAIGPSFSAMMLTWNGFSGISYAYSILMVVAFLMVLATLAYQRVQEGNSKLSPTVT